MTFSACGDRSNYLVPDEALGYFMDHCNKVVGEAYFRTPRTTIKAFVQLLSILDQNPSSDWCALIGQNKPEVDVPANDLASDEDDDLATLKL